MKIRWASLLIFISFSAAEAKPLFSFASCKSFFQSLVPNSLPQVYEGYTLDQRAPGFDLQNTERNIARAFPAQVDCPRPPCAFRGMVLSADALGNIVARRGLEVKKTTNAKQIYMSREPNIAFRQTLPSQVPGRKPARFVSVVTTIDLEQLSAPRLKNFRDGVVAYEGDIPAQAIEELWVYSPRSRHFEKIEMKLSPPPTQ